MSEPTPVREILDHWLEMIETAIEDGQEGVAYVHLEREDCQMLRDEFARLTGELQEIADIAGEALGTDPDLRAPLGCVQALANYHGQICEDLRSARADG